MKKTSLINLLVFTLLIFSAQSLLSQQWTEAQKDVWAGVEKYWEVSSTGNASAFLDYFDDSYIGWSYNTKVPMNKSNVGKWIKNDMSKNSTILYTLTPVSIWVEGDFAFVNYFYGQLEKDKDGKEKTTSGHWTDILKKRNGKWVLIGDHGGRTSKNN